MTHEHLKPDEIAMLEKREKALMPDSMERHGDGLTLYCGRDDQHHGLNLANHVDPRFGHWALAMRTDLPTILTRLANERAKLAIAIGAMNDVEGHDAVSDRAIILNALRRINELEKQHGKT